MKKKPSTTTTSKTPVKPAARFVVMAVHGESRSLFHVVDTKAPEPQQPAIIRSLANREAAEKCAKVHNSIK